METRLIAWVAEEMGREVPYPIVLHVDNTAGVSYQHSTCAASKLRGVCNQRKDWVQELKNKSIVTAVKVATEKNLADALTHAKSKRSIVNPNKGFIEQLKKLKS